MAATLQQLTSLEDFELLTAGQDIISVNGVSALYLGSSPKGVKVLRRMDTENIIEMNLLSERVEIKGDGSLRCIGTGAYEQKVYSMLGELPTTNQAEAWRQRVSEYETADTKLTGVGL